MIKKVNNKGFVFIETIITTVILLTALLVLYKSFSGVIINEKKRIYYDDASFIYKTIAIRDVLKKSYIDKKTFDKAYDKNYNCGTSSGVGGSACKWIYFFNIGSPIYYDNTNMETIRDFLNFYQLAYIKIEHLSLIKQCLNGTTFTGDDKKRCTNMKNYINVYAYTNLTDYLKSLDVDSDGTHTGILISIFFLTKSGEQVKANIQDVAFGKYEECLQDKVHAYYKKYYNKNITLDNAMKNYNNNKNLNFGIQCQYAYYYSWVYL